MLGGGRRIDEFQKIDSCVQRQLNTMRRPNNAKQAAKLYRKAVKECTAGVLGR